LDFTTARTGWPLGLNDCWKEKTGGKKSATN